MITLPPRDSEVRAHIDLEFLAVEGARDFASVPMWSDAVSGARSFLRAQTGALWVTVYAINSAGHLVLLEVAPTTAKVLWDFGHVSK